ncbi:coiled-coil domain-containing protein 1-like [Cynara cardunculus var. scolymus]|uniref:coiled-coil domain-containing protein 1-like n=1 Tax=Cynara cardunculus var. scolymus TaxID=59895 RepID=UPI000D624973|nr:coiled-coil domain-containing protein 1-like [Cynara cardunculus var. scolymus]
METDIHDMAEDVNLLLPVVETVLDKIDQVHQDMPTKEDLTHDISNVEDEVCEVKREKDQPEQITEETKAKTVVATEVDADPLAVIPQYEDAITFNEAKADTNAEDDDDVVISLTINEDLPITSALSVGDEEYDADEDLPLPDAEQDLSDDDDEDNNDDDNFTIQYHS